MTGESQVLDDVRGASACAASWSQMQGNDRARRCPRCRQCVYRITGMTRNEAEDFIHAAESRPVFVYYERRDGTIMTRDCLRGRRRRRAVWFTVVIAAI